MHWQIIDVQGRVVREAEQPTHNMIVDLTYNTLIPGFGILPLSQTAVVGTSSTPPSPADHSLHSEVAHTQWTPYPEKDEFIYVSPGVYEIRRVKQFYPQDIQGQHLTEWGFSPMIESTTFPVICRELFRDSRNNPTTVVVGPWQTLRMIYKMRVIMGPTSPQEVTVHVGGADPGPHTAKFLVTNRFGHLSHTNHIIDSGLRFETNQRGGDLFAISRMLRGDIAPGSNVYIVASADAAPLTYEHTINSIPSLPNGSGHLTANTPVGRSRTLNFLADSSTMNGVIKSVMISAGGGSTLFCPTINLVFDSGQEFAKANTHKLLIGNYSLEW